MSPVVIMLWSTLKYTESWHLNLLSGFQRIFLCMFSISCHRKSSSFRNSKVPVFREFFPMNLYRKNTGLLKSSGFQRIPVFRGSGFQSFYCILIGIQIYITIRKQFTRNLLQYLREVTWLLDGRSKWDCHNLQTCQSCSSWTVHWYNPL
jgi:hypothetical protein